MNSGETTTLVGDNWMTTWTPCTSDATRYCQWCGNGVIHSGACPRVKSIEYDQYGSVKRVEFFNERYPR